MYTDNNSLQHKRYYDIESVQNNQKSERSLFEEQERERLKLKNFKDISDAEWMNVNKIDTKKFSN